ncbi:MAG: HD domain-containing protein [Ruminococcus sp.]|nr:HD domain-containing protein [Ruminococcus sp.]
MIIVYYDIMLFLSLVMTAIYAIVWHKHFSIHITLIFALIPIADLGYLMLAQSDNVEAAFNAMKLIYLGGFFLNLFVTFSVFNLCRIELGKAIQAGLFILNILVYSCVLTIGRNGLFYKSATHYTAYGAGRMHKTYGPVHTVFYILLILYFILGVAASVYSIFKKKDVSNKIIYLLLFTEFIGIASYFLQKVLDVEFVPLSYFGAQVIYLLIIHRMCLYDIDDTVVDSLVQTGDTGFASFDFKLNYLGSNETAKQMFPELRDLTVDKPADINDKLKNTAVKWLSDFREDESKNKVFYEADDHIYLVNVSYLYDGIKKRGYQFFMTDDTRNQKYIALLDRYNSDLRREVDEKTRHIVEMHDNLVLSMATMVESRDNSTGGHIKRTSVGVRLLIEEIRKENKLGLSDEFCKDIIKAAPMHDLGKIAVDDAILRKPGRFTDEEFEIMKTHAAEGAHIVHEILKGTDDQEFHHIAENVAHYHHERWDGSGYPEGLAGEAIPLEARIMAIADVYDALVSKRVYKEKMSFEKADAIIMEGMGKHFDKQLEPYYVAARPKLEEYYSSIDC